jgi:hypothetical protein
MLGIKPGIHQGAQNHVAAGPAETIEERDS